MVYLVISYALFAQQNANNIQQNTHQPSDTYLAWGNKNQHHHSSKSNNIIFRMMVKIIIASYDVHHTMF